MDQFEFELRNALRRREPQAGFDARVMQPVREEAAKPRVVELRPRRRIGIPSWRWAAAGAVAASLCVGVVVENQRRVNALAAQEAAAALEETLFFAGSKIHQARDAVWGGDPGGEK